MSDRWGRNLEDAKKEDDLVAAVEKEARKRGYFYYKWSNNLALVSKTGGEPVFLLEDTIWEGEGEH